MSPRLNSQAIVRDLFAFGGSAGGLESLIGIVRSLPPNFPATVCVVLHRNPADSRFLAPVLARASALPVIEPQHGEPVATNRVYLAPRDFHLTIREHWLSGAAGRLAYYCLAGARTAWRG